MNAVNSGKHNLVLTAAALAALASCSGSNTLQPISDNPQIKVPVTNVSIDRENILASHNAVREQLDIPPLNWSNNLESLAADWANFLATDAGCTVRRRGTIGLPAHKNGIGENLQIHDPVRYDDGRVDVASIDENDVVLTWARQALNYDYKSNECSINEVCENYTQLVWRDSQVVGCAAASCPGKEQIWVCNYDPPGNYIGQKPY